MDANKMACLSQMAGEMQGQSKDSMMSFLMSATTKAESQGIEFTDSETDLLMAELTKNMSPQERQKITMMRKMAATFAKKKKPN